MLSQSTPVSKFVGMSTSRRFTYEPGQIPDIRLELFGRVPAPASGFFEGILGDEPTGTAAEGDGPIDGSDPGFAGWPALAAPAG